MGQGICSGAVGPEEVVERVGPPGAAGASVSEVVIPALPASALPPASTPSPPVLQAFDFEFDEDLHLRRLAQDFEALGAEVPDEVKAAPFCFGRVPARRDVKSWDAAPWTSALQCYDILELGDLSRFRCLILHGSRGVDELAATPVHGGGSAERRGSYLDLVRCSGRPLAVKCQEGAKQFDAQNRSTLGGDSPWAVSLYDAEAFAAFLKDPAGYVLRQDARAREATASSLSLASLFLPLAGRRPSPLPAHFIPEDALGPAVSLMSDDLPDWRLEVEQGVWRSFPAEASVELDRYWRAWQVDLYSRREAQASVAGPRAALLRGLLGRELVVDFAEMTCQIGGGRPKRIDRQLNQSGWLNNDYFFMAFLATFAESGADFSADPAQTFDFRRNRDFRDLAACAARAADRASFRGGYSYEPPLGWKSFAVNVQGKYEDDEWLNDDDTGWAVAYHGTTGKSLPGILASGFQVGRRQKFSRESHGVYCTPWIDVAQHFSKPQTLEGHSVQIVLQLRVLPSAIRNVTEEKATSFERKYWIVDPACVRAESVLIRELSLQEYVPPEAMVFGFENPHVQRLLERTSR